MGQRVPRNRDAFTKKRRKKKQEEKKMVRMCDGGRRYSIPPIVRWERAVARGPLEEEHSQNKNE